MALYLIVFAHYHLNFRLEELLSLSKLYCIPFKYNKDDYRLDSPYLIVEIEDDESARKLVSRAILVKEISRLVADSDTLDNLISECHIHSDSVFGTKYIDSSFRYTINSFGWRLSKAKKMELIAQFSFLPVQGPVDLKSPNIDLTLYCDFGDPNATVEDENIIKESKKHIKEDSEEAPPSFLVKKSIKPSKPLLEPKFEDIKHMYFGYLVGTGNRKSIADIDLRYRNYLGTTSMDAELSLIMANQALVKDTSFVLDPFVGTGSLMVGCSKLGAYTIGSDIDGRQIRGTGKKTSFQNNVEQYKLESKTIGTIVSDFAHHPWRKRNNDVEPFWDAIVTDPPYGVRAGAKKIGLGEKVDMNFHSTTMYKKDGKLRYPQTIPYEMEDVVCDLISFASENLCIGGRLVFWLPTVKGEYHNSDIPRHEAFNLIADSEQEFGRWSRRLVTLEKIKDAERDAWIPIQKDSDIFGLNGSMKEMNLGPAHSSERFLEAYYNK